MNDRAAVLAEFERMILKDRKHKLQFAVGSPMGGHSDTWAAWTTGNEFYLGARGFLNNTKVSLHNDGWCGLAITREAMPSVDPRALPKPGNRVLVEWKRPPAPTQGAHLTVLLSFPTNYLRLPAPQGSTKKPLLISEAAPSGKAAQFGFFFSREESSSLEQRLLAIGQPIFHWGLPNGDGVWLVAREADFDPSVIPAGPAWTRSMRLLDPAGWPELEIEAPNSTAILWNQPREEEALQMIEIGGISVVRNV